MMLVIPLTGTLLVINPLAGDPNDPVRPVDLDLGNVSWQMVSVDLENEVMVVDVSPGATISEPELNPDGSPKVGPESGKAVYKTRLTTDEEKQGFLDHAQELTMNHTKDELYTMSGCSRLRGPLKRDGVK